MKVKVKVAKLSALSPLPAWLAGWLAGWRGPVRALLEGSSSIGCLGQLLIGGRAAVEGIGLQSTQRSVSIKCHHFGVKKREQFGLFV